MSTGNVDLLIDSCISSIVLFLTQDLVQVVLTSTFSFFVFSFFSFSCPKDKSLARSRGFFRPPFFPCQPHNTSSHTASHAREQTDDFSSQRPVRTARCARQGAESGRRASPRMLLGNAMMVPPSPPLPLALVLRTGKNNGRARRERTQYDDPAAQRPDRTVCCAPGSRKAGSGALEQ